MLDQPNGMVVQAQLNITMPGWSVAFTEIGLPRVLSSLFHTVLLFLGRTHNLLPGVSPSNDDDYICTGVSIGDLSPDKVLAQYLTKVDQTATASIRLSMLSPSLLLAKMVQASRRTT